MIDLTTILAMLLIHFCISAGIYALIRRRETRSKNQKAI